MKLLVACCSLLLSAAALSAQGPMPPAPELKKLDALVGSWKGSGTVVMQPGMPPMQWTSVDNNRWVLGGHFLRQDTRIEFGEAMPGALQFTVFTGWDRERQRYRTLEVSNMGTVVLSDLHVLDNGAFVSTTTGVEEGLPTMDHWVQRMDGDRWTMVGHRAVGDGDPFVHVRGEMERTGDPSADMELADAAFMAPAAAEMQRVAAMAGTYDIDGKMSGPGAAEIAITGVGRCEMLFGGTVCTFHTTGEPMNYEAFGFIAWDPTINSYRSAGVSSMGEIHSSECRWNGRDLVYTMSMPQQGSLSVGRGIMRTSEDGALASVLADGIASSAEPARMFEATYTKQ